METLQTRKEQERLEQREDKTEDKDSGASIRLQRRPDGCLLLVKDDQTVPVTAKFCFPWSQPGKYISLRDEHNHEQALIERPEQLDDASRELLEDALVQAGFVFRVTRVDKLEHDFEIRVWKVQTEQGPYTFQTALDEWPRPIPSGGLLLRDIAGNLFVLPDPQQLDAKSRKVLWSFID